MKNVIKLIRKSIVLVTVFSTILSHASEVSTFFYKEDLKGNVSVTIDHVKQGNLLTIQDDYGTILFKEIISNSGTYTKGFDLTSLPDGDYFFEIEKDLEIDTIPFTVEASEVTFHKEKGTVVFKPYVRKKNDLILISKLSPNEEALHINVYDETSNASELVYSEEIKGIQNIERTYKLRKGKYKLVFNFSDREITKFINN